MTKLKNFEIPTDVKLSKNDEDNEFMNSFLYHNIYRTIENIKCVEEKRYDDRNFSICK